MQGFARTLGDDASQKRGGATVVNPAFARLHHDRPAQDIAIAIGRPVHGDLAVGRIGIGNAQLIPIGAHRHRQDMMNSPAAAIGIGKELGVFGKRTHERLIRRRHPARGQRNPVQ